MGNDLACGKVPLKSAQRRSAERTADPAAYLCRYTYAVAVVVFHDNRLDGMVVMQTEQEFNRSVLGLQLCNLLERLNAELLFQFGPQPLGQVTHGFKIVDTLHIQPVENLAAAECGLSIVLGPLLQFFQRKIIY
ncbi:hypothetical protein D3C75_1131510 [compost metagenome]